MCASLQQSGLYCRRFFLHPDGSFFIGKFFFVFLFSLELLANQNLEWYEMFKLRNCTNFFYFDSIAV